MRRGAPVVPIIDADSHLTEPPDLWTKRLPERFRALAPRVERQPETGRKLWLLDGHWLSPEAEFSRKPGYQDERTFPATWDEVDPACFDARARLAWMDAEGIYAQVIYPNLVAFQTFAIMGIEDRAQQVAIIRTYNDYLAEWASVAPERFVLNASLPFWDIEESIIEMKRCREMGFRGVLWAATLDRHGLPPFYDPAWDRLYAAAQDLEMPVNFHVGVGYTEDQAVAAAKTTELAATECSTMTYNVAISFQSNARTIAKLLLFGVCERFPRLAFVSVESGFGFVPFVLEALDWQWKQFDGPRLHPGRLLPSEYFARQVYTMFWFEQATLSQLPQFADNVMFETDFPHNTCLVPDSRISTAPGALAHQHVETFGEDVMRRVLFDNAARVYGVQAPPTDWSRAHAGATS
jgi:predicted TIM-barrel fold metal-dependent hydrolase